MFAMVEGVTAQGSPISVLRRAIKGGSLGAVDMALYDKPAIDLSDALEIIALMAEARDPRFARWAEQWAARIAIEERDRLAALLRSLPNDDAMERLRLHADELRRLHPAVRIVEPTDSPGV